MFHAVEWDGKTIGKCVALKVPVDLSEEALKQFKNESEILEKLNHEGFAGNVEKFYGM